MMRSHSLRLVLPLAGLLAILGLPPGRALAEDWIILGPRAMGMGGAGVATYHGGHGMYWNPASLGMAPYRLPDRDEIDEEELEAAERVESPEFDEEEIEVEPDPIAPVPFFDFGLVTSVNIEDTGDTVETIFEIQELVEELDFDEIETKLENGTPFTNQEVQTALELFETIPDLQDRGEGLLVTAGTGLGFRLGHVGLSLNALGYAGAEPVVDFLQNVSLGNQGIDQVLSNLPVPGAGQLNATSQNFANSLAGTGLITQNDAERLVFQAQTAGVNTGDTEFQNAVINVVQATFNADGADPTLASSIQNNQTGTRLRGAFVGEAAIGYAIPIGDWLSVGATVKAMHTTAYADAFTLEDLGNEDNFFDQLVSEENREESVDWGVDVGVLVRPVHWLVLGVTGKNLNQPEFDFKNGDTFTLDPQGRAGIAILPFDWLTLAADVDLFTNHSDIIPGHESQLIGGGAEINLYHLVYLRAGLSKNLKRSDNDLYLHAGVAVRIWYFSLEAGAVVPADLDDIDEISDIYDKVENLEDVPARVGASVMFGFNLPF